MSLPDPAAAGRPARGGIDRTVALVVLAFAAGVYALTYRFDEVPAALMSGLGAELFPRLVLATLAVLAVLLALGIGSPPMARLAPLPRQAWLTGGVLLGFMGAIELIGMWPSSLALLVGLGWLWGERSLWKLGLSAAGLVAALYLLFVRFLGGTFPRGMLGMAIWP
ncbi:MAG: tripartite tricarboxylate transporter TctB family protein [Rhodospirillales bacterium]